MSMQQRRQTYNRVWTRRELASLALGGGLALAAAAASARAENSPVSLKARAAQRGLLFGCGVTAAPLKQDAAFAAAVVADCAEIVAGNEMKWGFVEPRRGAPDFAAADAIFAFTRDNGLAMRGHTAIWHNNVPPWLAAALASPAAGEVFERRIRTVLGHFGDMIASWDVVNEAINPTDGLPLGLRDTIFYRAFGADYVARAFRIARDVLPKTPLYYNDYSVEYDFQTPKRAAVLALLESLRRQGLVDGLGVQSHLNVRLGFDAKAFRRFLRDVADLGLSILLTEFDVNDGPAPADIAVRDRMVAEHAQRYLDVALDEKAVKGMLAWDLSDRYTWLNVPPFNRPDRLPSRGQPLDEDLQAKPLWQAIARALDGAPTRS